MTPTERARQWRLNNHERYLKFLREWRVKNPEYMRKYRRKNRAKLTEQSQEWRDKNPEKVFKQRRQWTLKNHVKLAEQRRIWKSKNRKKLAEKSRQWRLENPEKFAAQLRNWFRKNPNKRAIHSSLRRARQRVATVGDLTKVAKIYERCADLRQGFKGLVVDHIIPLAKGGTHEANNLQIIYDFENQMKNDRLDYKPRVIFK